LLEVAIKILTLLQSNLTFMSHTDIVIWKQTKPNHSVILKKFAMNQILF